MLSYKERRIFDGIKAVMDNTVLDYGIFDFLMAIIYLKEVEMTETLRQMLVYETKSLKDYQGKDVADMLLAIKEALDC